MKLNMTLGELKQGLSLCIRCRMCTYGDWPENHPVCPIYDHYRVFTASAGGLIYLLRAISEGNADYSSIMPRLAFECTLCGQCDVCELIPQAPPYVTPSEIIRFFRYQINRRGLIPDENIQGIYEKIQQYTDYLGNYTELQVPVKIEDSNADIVLFAECFHSKAQLEIYRAALNLVLKTKTSINIFQTGGCCGSALYDLGFWEELKTLLFKKKEKMKLLSGKQILFVNPHCQEFIVRRLQDIEPDYPKMKGQHFSEFLVEQFKKGRITAKKGQHLKVAYQDPCHLGLGLGVYDPPRELISFLNGVELVEMERNRANAYCCGAGGGGRSQAFPQFSMETAKGRLQEFKKTRADLLITACPYCREIFQNGLGLEEKHRVKDLLELVDECTD